MTSVNLVIVGDSVLSAHDGTSFPDELVARLSGVADITLTNFAVPGQTLEQEMSLYASQAGAVYDATSFDRNICIIHHGSNDLLADISLSAWQALAQDLVDDLVATGYEVVTVEAYQWDFDAFPGYVFNTESDWNAYNSTVSSLAGISAVINTSAIPELTNQANVNNAPYYIDQEHLSATGAGLWADFAAPIVSDLIGVSPMALSRSVLLTEVGQTVQNGTPHTTSSFTTASNSLLVVAFNAYQRGADGSTNFTVTSSPSLTWTRRVSMVPFPTDGLGSPVAELWTAEVTSGASTTITVTAATDGVFDSDGIAEALSVTQYTGYDTSSPFGATGTASGFNHPNGPLSYSLSASSASDSMVQATVSLDGDHFLGMVDPGSGWTSLQKTQSGNDGWFRATTEGFSGATSTADFLNVDTPYGYATVALEIKAAAGGSIAAGAGSGSVTTSAVAGGSRIASAAGSCSVVSSASAGGGAILSRAGSAASVASATGAGTALKPAAGSASAVAAASGIGSSNVSRAGAAAVVVGATAGGAMNKAAAGSAAVVAGAAGVGSSTAASAGSAAVVVAASGQTSSGSVAAGAGTAGAVANAAAVGSSTASSGGSAASTANAAGAGAAIVSRAGAAAVIAGATGVGASTRSSGGSAAAVVSATAVGRSEASAAGSASVVTTASGVSAAGSIASGAGSALAVASALGSGSSVASSAGSAPVVTTVVGAGVSIVGRSGSAAVLAAAVAAGLAIVSRAANANVVTDGIAGGLVIASGTGNASVTTSGLARSTFNLSTQPAALIV